MNSKTLSLRALSVAVLLALFVFIALSANQSKDGVKSGLKNRMVKVTRLEGQPVEITAVKVRGKVVVRLSGFDG